MAPIFLMAMVNGLGEGNDNRAWAAGGAAASVIIKATVSYVRSHTGSTEDSG